MSEKSSASAPNAPAVAAPKRRSIGWYGWRPDTPDMRDHASRLMVKRVTRLPSSVDLSKKTFMPNVYDQGDLGSCTANAIAAAYEFETRKQALADFMPSRLAIYYGERLIENTVKSDAGAEIRDGMKVIAKSGVADESLWPYDIRKFAAAPPRAYTTAAKAHRCLSYEAVEPTEAAIKSHLAEGLPIVFGISVYDSFESDAVAQTGVVPMPKPRETMLGGHAILMTGYTSSTFRFRNSWGTSWGKKGYATLPKAYVLNPSLASDFWVVRSVE